MSLPPRYCPALDHLHNYVAAMEIELGRLVTEQQAVTRKLRLARAGRDDFLRAAGLPSNSSPSIVPFGTQPLSADLLVLTQAISSCEQALADLKRHIDLQRTKVAAAQRALADYIRQMTDATPASHGLAAARTTSPPGP